MSENTSPLSSEAQGFEPPQRPERVPLVTLAAMGEQPDDFARAIGDRTVPVAAFNSSI